MISYAWLNRLSPWLTASMRNDMEGWIKLHRKILDWEWYSDINTKVVFLHLLLSANHEDRKWKGIVIEKGQILTSQNILADTLGLSRREVRVALDHLEMTNEIAISATKRYSVITITNYASYQMIDDEQRPTEQPTKRPSNGQVMTKQRPSNDQASLKNVKNDKNEINIYIPPYNSPKSDTFSMKQQLISDGLSEELVNAYMRVRKNKKAPDSIVAYNGLKREADKAGISMVTAITECVERNWVGFKAEWYERVRPQVSLFTQQPERERAEAEMEEISRRTRAEREERERKEAEAARARDKQKILDSIYKQ